jgi:hypothetical protein
MRTIFSLDISLMTSISTKDTAAAVELSEKTKGMPGGFDNNTLKLNPRDIHARVTGNLIETIW